MFVVDESSESEVGGILTEMLKKSTEELEIKQGNSGSGNEGV